MSPEPRVVLQLAKEIVDAEETLKALQHRWDEIFAVDSTRNVSSDLFRPVPLRDVSFASQVEAVLQSAPNEPFTIRMVAAKLESDSLKVGRTLFRLANTGKIENPSRGLYQAKVRAAKPVEEEELLDLVEG